MGKNKARHILHGVLDCLPIILIPIFMIYSQNHEINDNTLQVQENKVVDFNQLIEDFEDREETSSTFTLEIVNNQFIFNGTPSSNEFSRFTKAFDVIQGHQYYFRLNNSGTEPASNTWQVYVVGQFTRYQITEYLVTAQTSGREYIQLAYYSGANLQCSFYYQCFDLTQMYGAGNEPTISEFNAHFTNYYYPYTESEAVVIENYETITYNDTDIMSQSFYCLYNAVDKYFNMGNVFGMKNLYTWFEVNIFGGSASPSIYIVWNIVLYEFIMDLLFLLYGLFMFFIDLCKRLMEKPLNSIK